MASLRKYHPYHLVTPSPWPAFVALAVFSTVVGITSLMHSYKLGGLLLFLGLINLLVIMGLWWRDVIREATFEGMHTIPVQTGLKLGFSLFIISEVMFFFGFFWAFFHSSLAPAVQIGSIWPPLAITPFDPTQVPLVNTLLLLTSGLTITQAHHSVISNERKIAIKAFIQTLVLACMFTGLQFEEYRTAAFAISDGIYGTTFYSITGLHGFHVIIGTLFIFVCFIRFFKNHFTAKHHLGFLFSIWYWHFVDVVWLFVYIFIYWWGGYYFCEIFD